MSKNMDRHVQLIVVGGGTAGMAAAIAGARLGLDTLVLEIDNDIGGVPVQSLMGSFANLFVNLDGKPLVGSIPLEILRRMVDTGELIYDDLQQAVHGKIGQPFTIPFQPETYLHVIKQMAQEAGVRILCNTHVVAVHKTGERVDEAVCKRGHATFVCTADMWIDATGDASFAFIAGAPCKAQEDSSFGQLMRIGGVNIQRYLDWLDTARPWEPDPEFITWLSHYTDLTIW